MKPCRLDDQHVAGEVAQGSLGGGADEQSLQRISRHCTHDDDERIDFLRERGKFLVREPGNEVGVVGRDLVVPDNFVEALRVLLPHLLFDFVERQ